MTRGLFVTGTDTGVGKTLVAAGILRWLRRQGIDAVPMKPVQTGAEPRGGALVAPDLEFCLAAAGIEPGPGERRLMLPYAYEPACSPHLAGRLAGRYPELSSIKDCAGRLLEGHRAVVVEGAGGIMVPLNEAETMLDLMKVLACPVVLVARLGLGTINHTLLSARVLQAAGLNLAGIVFNRTAPPRPEDSFIEQDNPACIARFSGATVLGQVRYFDSADAKAEGMWRQFEADMPGLGSLRDELAR